MFCYNCGCHLSEHDFCTACGADVSLYKKIVHVSNMFYNEGLEKAGVRDLSGAIVSLRQSLKFNKNNIEARNLLGLVYFETGEVVAALSEWVISKNIRAEKNIADVYIEMIQANGARLESINQTIKKYNQALLYCTQNSRDLATIQLKKVLSLNPKFIRAHQLLALLYISSEEWERAKRELNRCMEIDRNNTLTLRYMKEVELMLMPDETNKSGRRKNEDFVRYQSDNEIIIQPLNVKEQKRSGLASVLNTLVGMLIGLATMYFLVVPQVRAGVNEKAQEEILKIGNQLDIKSATITEYEATIKELESERDKLQGEMESYVGTDGTLQTIDNLFTAASSYMEEGDVTVTAQALESIANEVNIEEMSLPFQQLYNGIIQEIGPELAGSYLSIASDAYKEEDFELAIENYTKAVYYDATSVDALFGLGNAYRRNGDNTQAIDIYEQVIERFEGTQSAANARKYIDNLSAN
ncbi:tetratricopeptide repeat protein [Lachnospiraceae bacterium OttesenSCG-928-D06]|nr:tetratricopeptide repeat protein [Lachnospiraceae bacterium OttesenSCG-928-D06]